MELLMDAGCIQTCNREVASKLTQAPAEKQEYEAEVINALRGKSQFSAELLNKLIENTTEKANEAKALAEKCRAELEQSQKFREQYAGDMGTLLNWADIFERSALDVKKMIICQLIDRIQVKKNCQVEIDLNVAYEQFGLPALIDAAPTPVCIGAATREQMVTHRCRS
jgi:hypothetical protein